MRRHIAILAILASLVPVAALAFDLPPLPNFNAGNVLKAADLQAILQNLLDLRSLISTVGGNVGIGTLNPSAPLEVVGGTTGISQANQNGVIAKFTDGLGRAAVTVRGGVDGNPTPTDAALNVGGGAGLSYSIDANHNINATGYCIGGSCITSWPQNSSGSSSGYINVKDFGATGNGTNDDTSAIQRAINSASTRGGTVFFPPGNYPISSTLTSYPYVTLLGAGEGASGITANSDIQMLHFTGRGSGNDFEFLENISIYGPQTMTNATQNLVLVDANVVVNMYNCAIGGGNFALDDRGGDGIIENCYIAGLNSGNVISRGSNWWIRDKFDQDSPVTYGFYIEAPSGENHFNQSDFSGHYTYSVYIHDDAGQAITIFEGSVFSSPISINGARWTNFSNAELSTDISAVNTHITVVGSSAFSGISVGGPGSNTVCSGNYNISC